MNNKTQLFLAGATVLSLGAFLYFQSKEVDPLKEYKPIDIDSIIKIHESEVYTKSQINANNTNKLNTNGNDNNFTPYSKFIK